MYKYEMHCHTKEVSGCSKISGKKIVEFYKKAGYDGVVITDHFFNGNNIIPKFLPWKEKVKLFQRGYEAAKKRGDELGIDVFWAWEFTYVDGTDFLTYGLSADWLLKHENCHKMKIVDYCKLVHKSGGYVVHAHPFREDDYIEMIRLLPRDVDAVETINACRKDFENKMADQYADNYSLTKFCGTDNHVGMRERLASLEIPERAHSVSDIISAVKKNEHQIVLYSATETKDNVILEKIQ